MQYSLSLLALAATALASRHNHFGIHRRYEAGYNISSSAVAVESTTPVPVTPVELSTSAPVLESTPITSSGPFITELSSVASSVASSAVSSAVSSVASSVAISAVSSVVSSAVVPIGTGNVPAPAPEESHVAPGPGEEVVTEIVDSTLTYTLGSGSTASIVTTTVQHISTYTITKTVVLTRPVASATSAPTQAAVIVEDEGKDEPLTTIRLTSTLTQVVTVYPAPSKTSDVVSQVAANPTGAASDCQAASVIYVTEKETIYVTVPAPSAASSAAVVNTEAAVVIPSSAAVVNTEAAVVAPSSVAHVEQPLQSSQGGFYPTGLPATDSGKASSSGFLTSYQPNPTGYIRRSFAHRA